MSHHQLRVLGSEVRGRKRGVHAFVTRRASCSGKDFEVAFGYGVDETGRRRHGSDQGLDGETACQVARAVTAPAIGHGDETVSRIGVDGIFVARAYPTLIGQRDAVGDGGSLKRIPPLRV